MESVFVNIAHISSLVKELRKIVAIRAIVIIL